MKIRRVGTVGMALVLATVGVASASSCPARIKQAREALEQFKKTPGIAAIKDAKVAAVETNLKAAQGAHEAGDHDEAMRKVDEALNALRR
jgi:hypothetical protein